MRAERHARRGRVLALPTLGPAHLPSLLAEIAGVADASRRAAAFPFDRPELVWLYLARNAVWFAARQLGLDRGECLVPAYHHGVEVEALVAAGVRPRFYRVDERMRPDLDDLERRIGPRTRGVYLIHYLGFPGPAHELRALCDRRGLVLVEDCALALLSKDGDAPLGALGDASLFCLYKTLPLPHGGALLLPGGAARLPPLAPPPTPATARQALASLVSRVELRAGREARTAWRALRALGRRAADGVGTRPAGVGTQHFQLADLRLGMSPLARRLALREDAAHVVARRRANWARVHARLAPLAPPVFELDALPAGVCPLFYPLRTRDKWGVMARLGAAGVDTVDFWRTGHPACDLGEFPEVAALRRQIVELPIHQDLDEDAADALAQAAARALDRPHGTGRLRR